MKMVHPLISPSTRAASWTALAVGLLAAPQALSAQAPRPARSEPKLEYRIGPGDVLQIFVWKEPEFSRDVAVRMDGKMTVPLLGDVEAAGRAPQQLAGELATGLGRFLSSPQVTVGVSQANSSRFYVLGKVARAGEFPLNGRLTVLQALAVAGGLLEYAKTDQIVVIRPDATEGQSFVPFNYKRIEEAKDIGQNIVLRPGDTILVP